jgi:hypothetical protein
MKRAATSRMSKHVDNNALRARSRDPNLADNARQRCCAPSTAITSGTAMCASINHDKQHVKLTSQQDPAPVLVARDLTRVVATMKLH